MTITDPNTTYALATLDQPQLLELQELLLRAGFDPGPLDGIYGPKTRDAWGTFKKSVHLSQPENLEKISLDSLTRLRELAGKEKGIIHDFSTKAGTIKAIRWECEQFGLTLKSQQAYIIATVEHETANTFRPLEEYGKGRGRSYGLPDKQTGKVYYGRGFVQLTWKANYAKYSKILGIDMVNDPDLACDPNVALFILVHGFKHGTFTGKRLEQYVNTKITDFLNARRCINGTDRAGLIAGIARRYL